MSTNLDNTQGPVFVGMIVAAVLYGISCVQALYYYIDQDDHWHIKLIVAVVMIFDTVHQALITQAVYTYTITDWGDPAKLGVIVWSLVTEIMFTGMTAYIVQSFLTMRIWRLSGRNIYITGISMILSTAGFVVLIITIAKMSRLRNLSDFEKLKGLSISINALHAATDLLITATFCTLLNIYRTGFQKSEIIINRLISSTVNTGLLTSFCALASLISLLVAGNTFLNIAFFFCLGRLYTNTLLATLNARNRIRSVSSNAGELMDIPLSLRDLSKGGSTHHRDISIIVKTTSQKHHDQKFDEEIPRLPSVGESTRKGLY